MKETAKKLDREVGKILQEELKKAEKTDKKLVPLLAAFIKSCRGGKGIRGTLVILGYQLIRQASNKEIYQIAAAYEILHSAILVHDDIIDQSSRRRNGPSLYQALGGSHYGVSQAISLADYGFFLSFKLISESNFPAEKKISALELFSKVLMNTSLGEMLDLEITDPLTVMRLKTACYTIAGPLQIGAILAGADKKSIKVLGEFGENLGIAYQIRDDVLDLETSDPEKAKKEAEEYINKALQILPKDLKMSKLLEQLSKYLIERTE